MMREDFILGQSPLGFHKMAYTAWGNDASPMPILCVHGLTRNGRDFDYLAKALATTRAVFCPDIVGRGKSDYLQNPQYYNYAQYIADLTALIARMGAKEIDWVGTSMGGLLGMMMAAMPNNPIRRLVINDVGPYINLTGLTRIANYVGLLPEFSDIDGAERYLRKNYAPFGITDDAHWRHLAAHSIRALPGGKFTLAHDPGIAENFKSLTTDVDLWPVYDRITCPTLVLRGTLSDIFDRTTAGAMTGRGPKARLIEYDGIGHAPALMDPHQIKDVLDFLG